MSRTRSIADLSGSKVTAAALKPAVRPKRHRKPNGRGRQSDFDATNVGDEVERIRNLNKDDLRALWRQTFATVTPSALSKDLLARALAYRVQEQVLGRLDRATSMLLDRLARGERADAVKERRLQPGTVLVREYQGERHTVTIAADGFIWKASTYPSLSTIARAITGTAWNGPRFFGLRPSTDDAVEGAQS